MIPDKSSHVHITEYKTLGEFRFTIYGEKLTIKDLALADIIARKNSPFYTGCWQTLSKEFTLHTIYEFPLTVVYELTRTNIPV